MISRILLYIFYLFTPILLIASTILIINISSRDSTRISYHITTDTLINAENVFYNKPEDVFFKNEFYSSEDVIQFIQLYNYSEGDKITFNFADLCEKGYDFINQDINRISFNKIALNFTILNANKERINESKKCISLFLNHINNIFVSKYEKQKIIERINYNINILEFVINSHISENSYIETTIKTISNILNITYESIDKIINDNIDLSKNESILDLLVLLEENNKVIENARNNLKSSENIFIFNENKNKISELYYNFLIQKQKNIKKFLNNSNSQLNIQEIKIYNNNKNNLSVLNPGFIIFIILLSSLIIIIIELIYRRFRY